MHAVMCSQLPPTATVSSSAARSFSTAYELVAVAPRVLALTIDKVSGPSRGYELNFLIMQRLRCLPPAGPCLALRAAENAGCYLEGVSTCGITDALYC
jgi:hypothetical protein